MSELRWDPADGEWVIVAGQRAGRPREHPSPPQRPPTPDYVADCPFCPGNESQTPPAVLEVMDRQTGTWSLRGFPNKFAALEQDPPQPAESPGTLFTARSGQGVHEVLVETPWHNRFPALRSDEELSLMVRGYRDRYQALLERAAVRYVLVFKNHGQEAGTSMHHPHSQIIATPVAPEKVVRRAAIAAEHYARNNRCLYCHLAREEIRAGSRVVYHDRQYLVFHPFAAAHAAETWIMPLEHQPSIAHATDSGLVGLASALGRTLRQLKDAFGDPDYNYAIHCAPRGQEDQPWSHWYLQVIPRTGKVAGFELGSGIYINPTPPEETARMMRDASLVEHPPA